MSKDTRAKLVMAELNISYAHALRLVREYCATLTKSTTKDQIVAGAIALYRDKG